MTPLPTVLALWNIWVHVGTSNGSDVTSYVEMTVDNVLSCRTALGIPDVHPNHRLNGFTKFRAPLTGNPIETPGSIQ